MFSKLQFIWNPFHPHALIIVINRRHIPPRGSKGLQVGIIFVISIFITKMIPTIYIFPFHDPSYNHLHTYHFAGSTLALRTARGGSNGLVIVNASPKIKWITSCERDAKFSKMFTDWTWLQCRYMARKTFLRFLDTLKILIRRSRSKEIFARRSLLGIIKKKKIQVFLAEYTKFPYMKFTTLENIYSETLISKS